MWKTNPNRKWIVLLTVLIIGLNNSCYYDKQELLNTNTTTTGDCAASPASFKTDVLPLITSRCAIPGCHNTTASGGFIFQNYDQVSAAKNRINTEAVIQKTMPPTGPLPPAQINILKCWIEGGGLNN